MDLILNDLNISTMTRGENFMVFIAFLRESHARFKMALCFENANKAIIGITTLSLHPG